MLYTTSKAVCIVLGSVAQVVFFGAGLSTAQWVFAFVVPIAVVELAFVKSSARVNCASDVSNGNLVQAYYEDSLFVPMAIVCE